MLSVDLVFTILFFAVMIESIHYMVTSLCTKNLTECLILLAIVSAFSTLMLILINASVFTICLGLLSCSWAAWVAYSKSRTTEGESL